VSEFLDHLASLRAARLADLDLVAALYEQVELLDARVGALEAEMRRQRQAETPSKPKAMARVKGLFCVYCAKPLGEAKTARIFCSRGCSNR
jgi:hypothetical protein